MRHFFVLSPLVLFAYFIFGCNKPSGKINFSKEIALSSVVSASACKKVGDTIYIVGDDSPYLYMLNQSYHLIDSVLIFKTNKKRIDKAVKPDFESIESVDWKGEKALILFGSGTTRNRQIALVYLLSKRKLVTLDLRPFFLKLAKERNTIPEELNCEGIAVRKDKLILLLKSTNTIVTTNWTKFQLYMTDSITPPKFNFCDVKLPSRNQHQLQFTGADFAPNGKLYFTAYSKNGALPHQLYPKPRAIIGEININLLHNEDRPNYYELPPMLSYKFEGITVVDERKNKVEFVLVSDGERNLSHLIQCSIDK